MSAGQHVKYLHHLLIISAKIKMEGHHHPGHHRQSETFVLVGPGTSNTHVSVDRGNKFSWIQLLQIGLKHIRGRHC